MFNHLVIWEIKTMVLYRSWLCFLTLNQVSKVDVFYIKVPVSQRFTGALVVFFDLEHGSLSFWGGSYSEAGY